MRLRLYSSSTPAYSHGPWQWSIYTIITCTTTPDLRLEFDKCCARCARSALRCTQLCHVESGVAILTAKMTGATSSCNENFQHQSFKIWAVKYLDNKNVGHWALCNTLFICFWKDAIHSSPLPLLESRSAAVVGPPQFCNSSVHEAQVLASEHWD